MELSSNESIIHLSFAHMAIEKNQNPWGRFGATSYKAVSIQPIYLKNWANRVELAVLLAPKRPPG